MTTTEHGWIIDQDYIDEGGAVGIHGPSSISPKIVERLRAGEGEKFRLRDDDKILYFEGRLIDPVGSEETAFSPLNDFGMPSYGCTIQEYFDEKESSWKIL